MSVRNRRRKARVALLQSLFEWQWQNQNKDTDKTIEWLDAQGRLTNADREYFTTALKSITENPSELDRTFSPFLDRKIDELGGVELAVLRAGTFELIRHPEIARAIVINEWVEVTKRFGATGSHRYVNSILDCITDGES